MARGDVFRPAIADLIPYEPGKPVEEVQRELGLDRVVKLASNEGQFGPFPAAREAIERGIADYNRYPDGGAYRLSVALAEKHGVAPENVALAAGADAVIMYLSLAVLDPGDEVVCGWPSFPSYVLDAIKMGATPVRVPLTDDRYDLEALLARVGPRTKIVFVANPNNPTGTMVGRARARRVLRARPGARPHRPRRGLLRVPGRAGLPGRDRGVPEARRAPRARPPDVLEDLRARRAPRRVRDRAGRGRPGGQEGPECVRPEPGLAGRRLREPR